MPSPIIPRSKSVPDIAISDSSSDVLASNRSVRTTKSTGSPITNWQKKLGDLLKGKTNSHLTEKGLQEFNRRNELIEERYLTSSPYYRGLTNFSFAIQKEKPSELSPGRDSHATSYINSGSKFSFSSWFNPKKYDRSYSSLGSSWTKSSTSTSSSNETRFMTSSSSSSSMKITEKGVPVTKMRIRTTKNEIESEMKTVALQSKKSEDTVLSTMEKPLRERDSEPSSMVFLQPPTAPPPEPVPHLLQTIIPSVDQVFPQPPATPLCNEPSTPPPPQILHTYSQPQVPASGGDPYDKGEKKNVVEERAYLWADRYRPSQLDQFLCNKSTALWLRSLARGWHDINEEFDHFIFEGNPGVGKRTMIWALLGEIFGTEEVQAEVECRKFHLKGEAMDSILVNLTVSKHHVEVNLSELRGFEKHVIVELIKGKIRGTKTTSDSKEESCKAVILHEADKLSIDALTYIKWMLEKFEGCNQVFFCCSDAKKLEVIKPICKHVQLLEPSVEEIQAVLAKIATEENIQLPLQLATKIASNSKNNLRQAIRSFEASWYFSGCNDSLKEDQIIKTGWEDKIANIATNVVEEQSPMQLYYIRGEIKNLIEHNVAPEYIFQTLKEEIQKILPDQLKMQFAQLYDEYQDNNTTKYLHFGELDEGFNETQHDQKRNVQKFMRIEEFIARFMSWYKGFATKNMKV